ncbi:MAG TPA: hypothetical protein VII51_08360 [Gaiellaceae bacterium]
MRRLFATSAAGLAAVVCAAGSHAADVQPTVRGPVSAVAGRTVAFHARGFRPGSNLSLIVSPADKGSCCSVRITATFVASPSGAAALTFTLPLRYFSCATDALAHTRCRKVAWKRGEGAVLTVSGYLQQASATTVIAR